MKRYGRTYVKKAKGHSIHSRHSCRFCDENSHNKSGRWYYHWSTCSEIFKYHESQILIETYPSNRF